MTPIVLGNEDGVGAFLHVMIYLGKHASAKFTYYCAGDLFLLA